MRKTYDRIMARTKEFIPEEVLDAASKVFWEKGFEATSIDDLVTATGVNRASLYGTFGDKAALFQKVVDRYNCQFMQMLAGAGADRSGLAKIRAVFEVIARETCEESRGCLLVNTAAELGGRDPEMQAAAKRSREQVE